MRMTVMRHGAAGRDRRRWQFSLRTLCLVVLALCLLFSWVGARLNEGRKERAAAEKLAKVGGRVIFGHEGGAYWRWAPKALNELLYDHAVVLELSDTGAGDAELRYVTELPHLLVLDLDDTAVTDDGLRCLEGSRELMDLYLRRTLVTDAGIARLSKLPNLERLVVDNTAITDAGLAELRGLVRLRRVEARGTRVTREGVEQLQRVLPDLHIEWDDED